MFRPEKGLVVRAQGTGGQRGGWRGRRDRCCRAGHAFGFYTRLSGKLLEDCNRDRQDVS